MVEKWGVSGLYQPPSIWRDINMCIYTYLYLLVYESHLCLWHQYIVQVSGFEGCV